MGKEILTKVGKEDRRLKEKKSDSKDCTGQENYKALESEMYSENKGTEEGRQN